MICPYCNSPKNRVLRTESLMQTTRVRRCTECGRVFQTTEIVDYETRIFAKALLKEGKDGRQAAHA